jgi:hypothetical protein
MRIGPHNANEVAVYGKYENLDGSSLCNKDCVNSFWLFGVCRAYFVLRWKF